MNIRNKYFQGEEISATTFLLELNYPFSMQGPPSCVTLHLPILLWHRRDVRNSLW